MFRNNCCCGSRQNMGMFNNGFMTAQPMMEQQVIEPTITKCVEQEFYHEVPHVCPIHTHTINKHIYKHFHTNLAHVSLYQLEMLYLSYTLLVLSYNKTYLHLI